MYHFPKEMHTDSPRVADLLLWGGLLHGPEPAVLMNKDGNYQATLRYRGQDVAMMADEERYAYLLGLHMVLRRLGSGWGLLAEERHDETTDYATGQWPGVASWLVDCERQMQFQRAGQHFEDTHWLTLTWQPPPAYQRSWYDGFFTDRGDSEPDGTAAAQNLATFLHGIDQVLSALATRMPVRWCTPDETLTYLHRCVSWDEHTVGLPDVPLFLDSLLSTADLQSGYTPKLGEKFLRPICIKTWPRQMGMHIPVALQTLPFPYRYTVRWLALDGADARQVLTTMQKKWSNQTKRIAVLILEALTRTTSDKINAQAEENTQSLQRAINSLALGDIAYGYCTPTVLVWGDTQREVDEREREVIRRLQAFDITPVGERVNAVMAWLGTLPGDVYHNVRAPLLHSQALAFLLPHSAIWAGPRMDQYLQAPPLFTASSEGVPFRYALHPPGSEVGHTMVIGPTRSGKSALLGFMAMQFQRYANAQVFCFDKDHSLYCATVMAEGAHYTLGGSSARGFQPLGAIDQNESERRWAVEWVQDLFLAQDMPLSPEDKEQLWLAIGRVATMEPTLRRLSTLKAQVQDNRLRQGLTQFLEGGAFGFLDATQDGFGVDGTDWCCFEMGELLSLPAAVPHVLSYLFHQLDRRFDGRPTLVILDEAWQYMAHPIFAPRIAMWLKSKAKMNVSVVLSSQEIVDASRTDLWQAIQGSIQTRVFLPNSAAGNIDVKPHYRACGVSDAHISLLTHARAKVDYFYTSATGSRMFQLQLTPVERLLCAASTPEEVAALRTVVQTAGLAPVQAAWLRHHGREDVAAEIIAEYDSTRVRAQPPASLIEAILDSREPLTKEVTIALA